MEFNYDFTGLLPVSIAEISREWLREDTPSLDIGGFVVGAEEQTAQILFKTTGVLAGRPFADAIFAELNCSTEWLVPEGSELNTDGPAKLCVAIVKGRCCDLLKAERVALNVLSRASGVATIARRVRKIALGIAWQGEVAGTRKTTPGFRLVEKYALLVGGISMHRNDLSGMVMLKDNHIWSTGSITTAVKKARLAAGFTTKIEVECQDESEALEACAAGADIVMLDNTTDITLLNADAGRIKAAFPHIIVEASGGITLDNIETYMQPNVDVISSSMFTQGYSCMDISMKISREMGNVC